MVSDKTIDIILSQDFFPKLGGAHSWLYEVYRRWPTKVIYLTSFQSDDLQDCTQQQEFDRLNHGQLEIIRDGLNLAKINLLELHCIKRYLQILKRTKKIAGKAFATLHCLRAFPDGFAGLLFKRLKLGKTKLVTYAHGEEILIAGTSRQLMLMTKAVYAGSDLVICNSRNTVQMVKAICPEANTVCIHPGVDSSAYKLPQQDIAAYRSKWGWTSDTVIISTIARMELRKNHAAVIRAVSALRGQGLSIAYICGTSGDEHEKLKALTKSLNIGNAVQFTGTLTDKEKKLTYCASDIHAMPSIRSGDLIEGFGIVFLEAAAAGIPSISGSNGGQSEAVLHEKTGLVVDGSNNEEIIKAIRILASDELMRRQMGIEGRKWAVQHDWSLIVEKTSSAIKSITKRF